MIISDLDLGLDSPPRSMNSGLQLGSFLVFGSREVTTINGARELTLSGQVTISAPFAIGGAAANSNQALIYLAQQLEELAKNPDLQPVYIQFKSGAGVITPCEHDGWYVIESCQIDRWGFAWKTFTPVTLSIRKVNAASLRRIAMRTDGAALGSSYSGPATNWYAFPFNVFNWFTNIVRAGAESVLFLPANYAAAGFNPVPFIPSAVVGDWFKAGCRVFDAINTLGVDPVSLTGTFLNANWVEVKSSDHRFAGDVVITNGLLMLTFRVGALPGVTVYLWNAALATPAWQSVAFIHTFDSGSTEGTLRQVNVTKIGLEEVACEVIYTTVNGHVSRVRIRLARGSYFCRFDFTPLTYASTTTYNLYAESPLPKILYNSLSTWDGAVMGSGAGAMPTDYGYGAWTPATAALSYLSGWLYQNQPAAGQPWSNGSTAVGTGDNSGPAQGATRSYSFFSVPYGSVSGGKAADKLQAEAETNIAAPFITTADGGASNGNDARLPLGTAAAFNRTFPQAAAWTPVAGTYQVRLRAKTGTAGAGVNQEVKIGLWSGGAFLAGSFFFLRPVDMNTIHLWFKGPSIALDGATAVQLVIEQENFVPSVDWYFDEIAIVPITSSSRFDFPQDLAQQFLYDRTARIVRS